MKMNNKGKSNYQSISNPSNLANIIEIPLQPSTSSTNTQLEVLNNNN